MDPLPNLEVRQYEREATPVERFFTRSPYSIVTMVARIKGHVSGALLQQAVDKVQQRHALLRVRLEDGPGGALRFTSAGVQSIPIEDSV
jgi:hypothetical protein